MTPGTTEAPLLPPMVLALVRTPVEDLLRPTAPTALMLALEVSRVVGKSIAMAARLQYPEASLADSRDSCGEDGHMARQCPNAPEGGGNDGKCFNCGEEG